MKKFKKTLSFLLTLCLLLNLVCMGAITASAVEITSKPANGETTGQPFAPGTGGSNNFRIPGIVTLDDGTVIATIDARWTWAADAGGIDTLVSVSKDNGENWTYTFANYLGDNGNVANNQSCCFIDPAIATDGTTAYMIADLYPAGFAINSARYSAQAGSTGFDASGNLLLRSDSEQGLTFGNNGYETGAKNATYGYYLKDGKIYTTAGAEVSGYSVDAHFNITGTDGTNTNLFFSDSPYKPFPTDFLYMTKTTDGLNWSDPELLNVKAAEEQSYLVGPGNGTYDAVNGNMVFTAYRHTSGASDTAYECTSLIWMDSEGNWKRSEDCTTANWSSEASAVVLADGTVRVFYRDGFSYLRYTDMVWDAEQENYFRDPNATEVGTTATKDSGCQLTAIKYSEQINGKDLILVATPTTSRRMNGHVYGFLVNEDNSMTLIYDHDITPKNTEAYAYSCLTELSNGDLGLLWESGGSAVTYTVLDIDEVLSRENNITLTFVNKELYTGETFTYTDNTGNYESADLSDLITEVASVDIKGSTVVSNVAQTLGSGTNVLLEDCLFTFTASGSNYVISSELADGTVVYLNHFETTNNNIPLTTGSNTVAVTEGTGSLADMFKLVSQATANGSGSTRSLHFHMESATPNWNRCGNDTSEKCHEYLYRPANADETASSEIPGYVRITSLDEIENGGQYLIAAKNDAGNWFVLNPSNSSTALEYVAKVVGESSVSSSVITFTAEGAGETEVQIGNVVYVIKVTDLIKKDVTIEAGKSVELTDEAGYYVGADTSDLDANVATVTIKGNPTAFTKTASAEAASEIEDGSKYLIVNTRANKPMTNEPASAAAAAGAGSGLSLTGSIENVVDASVWMIEGSDGTYTAKDVNGKYLTIGNSSAGVSENAANLSIALNGETWTINQGGAYLNDFGNNKGCAAGWIDGGASIDGGSQWKFYNVIETPVDGTTTLTFTGVAPGSDSIQIGDVVYNITVVAAEPTENVSLTVDKTAEYTDNTGDYTSADTSALDANVASVRMEAVSSTVHVAGIGSDTNYNASTVALADCLYTFTYDESTGHWTAVASDAAGNPVYLYPGNTTSSGYPNRTEAYADLSLLAGNEADSIAIMSNHCDNGNQNTSYLYFDRSTLKWDRVSDPGTNATWQTNTSLRLYRAAVEGEESSAEIPGYVRVTAVGDVTEGEYLVAAPDTNGGIYLLYPSVSTATRYNQIAKVTSQEAYSTKITFTGVGVGNTSVKIGDVKYVINVADKVSSFTADKTELTADGGEIVVTITGTDLPDTIKVKAGEMEAVSATGDAVEQTATLTIPANETEDEVTYTIQYSLDGETYTGEIIVTVAPLGEEIVVAVAAGKTVTRDFPGNLADKVDTSKLEEEIATVTVVGADATEGGLSTAVSTIESGKKYLIVNDRAGKPVVNDTSATWNEYTGLALSGSTTAYTDAAVWTVEAVEGGYTLKNGGSYMTMTEGVYSASVGDTPVVMTIALNETTDKWNLNVGEFYLNNAGGQGACAFFWDGETWYDAPNDQGSQWTIYEVTEGTEASTTVTITGVAEGETSFRVGPNRFKVIVHECVYDQQRTEEAYLATPADCVNAATYYYSCACGEKGTETFSNGDALGHTYGAPAFTWTELTAEATFTCSVCADDVDGHTVTETAAVEQTGSTAGDCKTKATTTYTATVTFEGSEYTDTKTVEGDFGEHTGDEDKNHKCDTCDEILSTCTDENGDYKCDICGAELDKPTDPKPSEPDDNDPKPSEPEEDDPKPSEPEEDEPKYELPECGMDEDCVLSQFSDVKIDDWYHDGVHFCVDHGIVNGMGNGTFAPNDPTTRAQLVTMLYRLEGEPSIEGLAEPFTDVSENDWFYAPIVWAYNNKVVNGMTETTFAPDAKITREQVATILHRYLGTPAGSGDLSIYPDADKVQDYAKDALTWAVGEGLINGVAQTDGTSLLAPDGNATRAQIATILMRHLTA